MVERSRIEFARVALESLALHAPSARGEDRHRAQ
jgi:hypothetical protein